MKEEVGRLIVLRAQELREGRGDRPGLPGVPNMVLMVSVDVKQHLKKDCSFSGCLHGREDF